jgi:hypothetical protein
LPYTNIFIKTGGSIQNNFAEGFGSDTRNRIFFGASNAPKDNDPDFVVIEPGTNYHIPASK